MSHGALASWNEGTARTEALDFVRRATKEGPDFVPAAERIATFDNDGTLWVEKPAPPPCEFLLRTWSEAIKDDPALAGQQLCKAIDEAFFEGLVTQDPTVVASLEGAVARSWAGTTPEVFDAQVQHCVDTVKSPKCGVG